MVGMSIRPLTTRYATWSRWQAMGMLVLVAALLIWLLHAALTGPTLPPRHGPAETDADLFRKVVERVRSGQGYYEAQEQVFDEYKYPVSSVLNYRTPVYAWVLAAIPHGRDRAVLAALALTVLLLTYAVVE